MNYFLAINCSQIQNHLKSLQYEINVPNKVTYVENFHLTLKFFGDIKDTKILEIIIKKLSFLKEIKEFEITISQLGEFVIGEEKRIVWVGIKEKEIIKKFVEKIDDILYPIFEKNKRFFPHITLLRIKNDKNLFKWNLFDNKDISKCVNTKNIDEKTLKVNEIQLLKSELLDNKIEYTLIQRYNLEKKA